jgi:hypothetical protein
MHACMCSSMFDLDVVRMDDFLDADVESASVRHRDGQHRVRECLVQSYVMDHVQVVPFDCEGFVRLDLSVFSRHVSVSVFE